MTAKPPAERQPSTGGAEKMTKAWYFNRLEPSGTVVAVEPDGTEHVVKHGDMNSLAGRALLEAMTRALCTPHPSALPDK